MTTKATSLPLRALCLSLMLGVLSAKPAAAATEVKAIYVVQVKPQHEKGEALGKFDLNRARKCIIKRLRALEVKDIETSILDKDKIAIKVPPKTDPLSMESVLRPALFELRLVDMKETRKARIGEGKYEAPLGKIGMTLEPFAADIKEAKAKGEKAKSEIIVVTDPALADPDFSGKYFKAATAVNRPEGWCVEVEVDKKGASILGPLTEANTGRRVAMILDDEILCAPTIVSRFTDRFLVAGEFKEETARGLAVALMHTHNYEIKLIKAPKAKASSGSSKTDSRNSRPEKAGAASKP